MQEVQVSLSLLEHEDMPLAQIESDFARRDVVDKAQTLWELVALIQYAQIRNEGIIETRTTTDADGNESTVTIKHGLGPDFMRAVMATVKQAGMVAPTKRGASAINDLDERIKELANEGTPV